MFQILMINYYVQICTGVV